MPSFKSPDISLAIAFSIVRFDIYKKNKKNSRSTEVLSQKFYETKLGSLVTIAFYHHWQKHNVVMISIHQATQTTNKQNRLTFAYSSKVNRSCALLLDAMTTLNLKQQIRITK